MGELASPLGSTQPATADLATLALDVRRWDVERARALGVEPGPAIAAITARWRLLKEIEPQGGEKTSALVRSLSTIGAKIAPTMGDEQTKAWIAAMVEALSDLPYAFALRGTRDAVHVPMRFLNEVEAAIRDKADLARARHQAALYRLQAFERMLKTAAAPKLPPPEAKELTAADIAAMPLRLRQLGLKLGHITQEQFDEAERTTNAEA